MKKTHSGSAFWPGLILVLLVAPGALRAYTDPGSGLLIWQIVGAFFAGGLYQLRKFFRRRGSGPEDAASSDRKPDQGAADAGSTER